MSASPPFAIPLTTERLGQQLHFVPEVDSTNRVLRELAEAGASEGTVVLTDYQAAGRGRRGRGWHAPRGSSLLFSVLLRPPRVSERHGLLPIVVGVAVARALERQLAVQPTLKWPNDLLLDGKKCCGILLESVIAATDAPVILVGIGLNVNQTERTMAEIPSATSLRATRGEPVERGPLLATLLAELERAYDAFAAGWSPREAWRRRALLLGKRVRIHAAGEAPWSATALDLAPDGRLLVRDEAGWVRRLDAQEVTLRATGPGALGKTEPHK